MSTVGLVAGRLAMVVVSAAVAVLIGYVAVAALDGPDDAPVPAIDLDRQPPPDRLPVEVSPTDVGNGATVLPPPTLPPVTTMPPAPPASAPQPAPPVPSPPPPPPASSADDDDDDDDDDDADDADDHDD